MNNSTQAEVCDITASVLGVDARAITSDSSPKTIDAWDSVQQLNLILALEERFQLNFEPEEIDMMGSVGSIAAIVDRKRSSAA